MEELPHTIAPYVQVKDLLMVSKCVGILDVIVYINLYTPNVL